MLTRDFAITNVQNFITDLKTLGYNPIQAFIFGSVVTNTTHKYSDIDLALWDKKFTGVLHLDYEKIKSLLGKYKYIELHSYSEDTDEDNDPFVKVIKQTGLKVNV